MRYSTLTLLSIIATAMAKNVNTGFAHLNFDVLKGNSFQDANKENVPKFVKRENQDGTIDMALTNQDTFYSVTLEVGSEKEKVVVLVDTGSSDLWISSNKNSFCSSNGSSYSKYRKIDDKDMAIEILGADAFERLNRRSNSKYRVLDDLEAFNKLSNNLGLAGSKTEKDASDSTLSSENTYGTMDCTEYGTFDEDASTSWKTNNTDFFISYGDNSYALGEWGYDTVTIGDITVKDFSFAVANQSNSSVGVLGIGLKGLETTNVGSASAQSAYTYANLPMKMVEDGLIHKNAYSLWLNQPKASSGSVLFGAVDHAKYTGDLTLVPILNTYKSQGFDEPLRLEVTLTSLSYSSGSSTTKVSSKKAPALLDSGTTLTYLPSNVISAIADALDATYIDSYGAYAVDCNAASNDASFVFNFQGADIKAPLSNFILPASESPSESTCILGVIDSDYIILGDSFLRSAYVVYDLDLLQIAMAQVEYTSSENIEVITGTIPGATTAAAYNDIYSGNAVNFMAEVVGSSASASASGSASAKASSAADSSSASGSASGSSTASASGSASSSAASSAKASSSSSSGASSMAVSPSAFVTNLWSLLIVSVTVGSLTLFTV